MEYIFISLISAVVSFAAGVGILFLPFRDDYTEAEDLNYKALNRMGKSNRITMVVATGIAMVLSLLCYVLCLNA